MSEKATINKFPDLIRAEFVRRAEEFGAALMSDGMKGLDIPREGCMSAALKPIDASMKVAGTAVTVETAGGDNLPINLATYAAGPGFVMVVDGQGYTERAYVGDLVLGAAKAVGFRGIIVDGCIRDRLGAMEVGLPVFATGVIPRGPVKQNPGKVNLPIMCCGVRVRPGDLVVGDADGVVVVPAEFIERVLAKAEEKQAYEIRRRQLIREYGEAVAAGLVPPELAPDRVAEMLGK